MKPRHLWKRPKRSALKPRTTPLARTRKAVKKVNAARLKRRLAKYKAFMCSPEWKAIRAKALKRAGHQCQFMYSHVLDGTRWKSRCLTTEALHVHHVRYGLRFGGRELPKDLQVLCKVHHDAVEALKGKVPLWKRAWLAREAVA